MGCTVFTIWDRRHRHHRSHCHSHPNRHRQYRQIIRDRQRVRRKVCRADGRPSERSAWADSMHKVTLALWLTFTLTKIDRVAAVWPPGMNPVKLQIKKKLPILIVLLLLIQFY